MSPTNAQGDYVAPTGDAWWIRRGPREGTNEAEQLLGRSFTPSVQYEGYLVLEARHPKVYGRVLEHTRAVVTDYAGRREARLSTDPEMAAQLPQIDVDAIDAAVAALDDRVPSIPAIDAEHRAAFHSAARAGDWPDMVTEFRAWQAALAAAVAAYESSANATQLLGIPGRSVPTDVRRPHFTEELDAAMGSPERLQYMPL